jgi:phenylalanyl-tRNA synthetase beta subunit
MTATNMNPAQMAVKIEILATPIALSGEGEVNTRSNGADFPLSPASALVSALKLTYDEVKRLLQLELVAEEVESCMIR